MCVINELDSHKSLQQEGKNFAETNTYTDSDYKWLHAVDA